jgi:hypothetical protein
MACCVEMLGPPRFPHPRPHLAGGATGTPPTCGRTAMEAPPWGLVCVFGERHSMTFPCFGGWLGARHRAAACCRIVTCLLLATHLAWFSRSWHCSYVCCPAACLLLTPTAARQPGPTCGFVPPFDGLNLLPLAWSSTCICLGQQMSHRLVWEVPAAAHAGCSTMALVPALRARPSLTSWLCCVAYPLLGAHMLAPAR